MCLPGPVGRFGPGQGEQAVDQPRQAPGLRDRGVDVGRRDRIGRRYRSTGWASAARRPTSAPARSCGSTTKTSWPAWHVPGRRGAAVPWAEAESIPLTSFQTLKVPDDVLRAAGFKLPAGDKNGRGPAPNRQRAKAVPVDEIKTFVMKLKGVFRYHDIRVGVGGGEVTIRKAVDELIEAGKVEDLGDDPDFSGRGRRPKIFQVIG